jgi:hypothetical protein
MRKLWIICCFLFIISMGLAAQTKIVVKRENSVLRAAQGSYAQIIKKLPVGTSMTLLQADDPWLKVKSGTSTGYVTRSIITAKPPRNNVFAQMATQETGTTVSRHGMSAGVKGFGEKFTKVFKGDPSFLDLAMTYQLDSSQYEKFRKDTYKGFSIKKLRKATPLPERKDPDYYTDAESGFGLGLASAIASQGLYKNEQVMQYVNDVGNLVADASDVPDVQFKFFILDIPAANSYACPGGIIFVTKGMLKYVRNEAELACVLGHEIAHVSRLHGVKEMEKQKNQIAAEDAFAELDAELPPEQDIELAKTEQELDDESFSIFQYLIQGRLSKYEEEADKLGLRFAVRAGYDPNAILSLLDRLINNPIPANNEHYTPENLKNRITWITKELNKRKYPANLLRFPDRSNLNLSPVLKK